MGDKLLSIYETLLAHYGELHWWPAKTPYEVIVGAVLTQNTAWGNVEKAIANFGENLSPETVANADLAELTEIIRPAGFFNQKAGYLKAVTAWFAGYDYDIPTVRREPLGKLRAGLLLTKGVGRETADSILLYAFGFLTFVVDAYTVRLCGRYPIDAGKGYAAVKAYFEGNLPQSTEVYNNFHALIVANAKAHCRKKPSYEDYPFDDIAADGAWTVMRHRTNKVHWNTVTLGGDVPEEELKRMVGRSYGLMMNVLTSFSLLMKS